MRVMGLEPMTTGLKVRCKISKISSLVKDEFFEKIFIFFLKKEKNVT
jgi:hypothetical protein